jgi:hypothetical protein
MADKSSKVSEFTGRRADKPAENQPAVFLGNDTGNFQREPCGTCVHWKKDPAAGIGQGVCMNGPPIPFPIQRGQQTGQALVRPVIEANMEGCDQWDDDSDLEDGDGQPAAAARIAAAG